MADEQSIWKKEISFGRKRKQPEPEVEANAAAPDVPADGETTSMWKKEISFGRKKKSEPEPVAQEPVAEEPVGEDVEESAAAGEPAIEEQVWKREVSFSR